MSFFFVGNELCGVHEVCMKCEHMQIMIFIGIKLVTTNSSCTAFSDINSCDATFSGGSF